MVGAGIAGLTLGGLLCRQERPPVIVERSASPADGYAIGVTWPPFRPLAVACPDLTLRGVGSRS